MKTEAWLQAVIDHARQHGATRFNVVKEYGHTVILQCFTKNDHKVFDRVLHRVRLNPGDTYASVAFRLRRAHTEYVHWVKLITEVRK